MADKKLLEQLADSIRMKHYSPKTVEAYVNWNRQYILFHKKRHPQEMGLPEIKAFLALPQNSLFDCPENRWKMPISGLNGHVETFQSISGSRRQSVP